jgi:putative restriction endonuclease
MSDTLKDYYVKYMFEQNIEGSGMASSYIRALDLLNQIIVRTGLFGHQDFWTIDSIKDIDRLYEYALRNQRREDSEFLQSDLPPSYGRNSYYSAALKSFYQFLVLYRYKKRLWKVYNEHNVDASELSKRLEKEDIESIEALIPECEIDFSSKEGKNILRKTKVRVNQDFFRDMVLDNYKSQCCLTGLNVPDVLRASHIVGWADDPDNRLNPANGLCLSATYDAAFDRHLISFDENYRLIFSSTLKEYYTNQAFKTHFLALKGQTLTIPTRFKPSQEFLIKHREQLK